MTDIASLSVLVGANISGFMSGMQTVQTGLNSVSARLQTAGQGLTNFGGGVAQAFAPAGVALLMATGMATDFNESMVNTGAVMGAAQAQIADMSDEILDMGADAIAGPQAVADAYYDVVGGVTNASARMATLEGAVALAEAGNANLAGSTQGMISVMNAYGFSAEQAGYVTDVFTRTVGMGVGSMDEFVSAISPVAGIASQTGVTFSELGTATAYMTTQGFTAAQSSTRLQQAIVSLLNPNAAMTRALQQMGVASGSAALEQYGLAGTLALMNEALGGNVDMMAEALGSTEALGAAMALTGDGFTQFSADFQSGVHGATDAARNIQLTSAAAQFDLLKASADALAISIGSSVMIALQDFAVDLKPVVDNIRAWVEANPQLAGTIAMVIGGIAALGAVAIPVGMALSGIGTIVATLTTPFMLAAIGATLVAGAIGAILSASGELQPTLDALGSGLEKIGEGDVAGGLLQIAGAVASIPVNVFASGLEFFSELTGIDMSGAVTQLREFANGLMNLDVETARSAIIGAFEDAWTGLQIIFDNIKRGLEMFFLQAQISVLGFVADLRQDILNASGGQIDIAPNINFQVGDLQTRLADMQIGNEVTNAINAQLAAGRVIDLSETITFETAQGTISTSLSNLLSDPAIIAAGGTALRETIRGALENAFSTQSAIGGQEQTILELSNIALQLGIDPAQVQAEVEAELAAIRAQASMTVDLTVTPGSINIAAVNAGMTAALASIGAANSAGGGGAATPTGLGYIPTFALGGMMRNEGLAYLHPGERVLNPDETRAYNAGGGGDTYIALNQWGTSPFDALALVRRAASDRGGNYNQ